MNTKHLKLLAMLLFSLNCAETQLSARNLDAPLYDWSPKLDAIKNISIITGMVGLAAMSQYVATTYLVQEEQLVKAKYPHAQAWYEAMTQKYPKAHLDSKLFLQTMRGIPAKLMSWCSTMNQIYFPQDALKDINNIYKKQLDAIMLTEEETVFLGMQEFILLHEAGHIEHNDMTKRYLTIIGVFASLEIVRAIYRINSDQHNLNAIYNADPLFTNSRDAATLVRFCYDFLVFYAELIAFGNIIPIFIRSQEFGADTFAYQQADKNALQGGVAFFEDEERDPLFDIANKQLSPFIKVESTVGNIAQTLTSCIDVPVFYIDKTIKRLIASTSFTRWIYDYCRGASHPGPSVRAQNIKNEIAHRD